MQPCFRFFQKSFFERNKVKVANAAVVYITPYLMKWSTPGTLLFFGVLNLLNALFVVVYIKETFPLFVSPLFLVAESLSRWIFSFKGLGCNARARKTVVCKTGFKFSYAGFGKYGIGLTDRLRTSSCNKTYERQPDSTLAEHEHTQHTPKYHN